MGVSAKRFSIEYGGSLVSGARSRQMSLDSQNREERDGGTGER